MKTVRTIVWCLVIVGVCCAVSLAQSSGAQRYSKDGLSFEYGNGWRLTDKSNELAQHIVLSREGSSAQMMILAYRYLVMTPEQLAEQRRDVTDLFINKTTQTLQTMDASVKREDAALKVGHDLAVGVRLRGTSNKVSTTAEIYSFLGKLRFINVAYIRPDSEAAQDDPAWMTVLGSFKIGIPLIGSKDQGGVGQEFPEEYLQKRATSLPRPAYPLRARNKRVSGMVIVSVVVDENGNVAAVYGALGPPLLVQAAKDAALGARFTPTVIAGQPVRVTGKITYKFVAP